MAADPRTTPPQAPAPASDGVVCPFCAHVRGVREASSACPKCTMEDTLNTRKSTGERIGPWFVLQRKNPTAPGLRFSVLLTLARRGHVTPKSIVRGPTTGQLWRFASEVKGLSRMFGICWHCKASVSPDATTCPRCKSAQEIPDDPDVFLESHSSLPLMRELSTDGFGPAAENLPAAHLPANGGAISPRGNGPARRARPDGPREPNGLDDLADLTRALALTRPAEPEPLRPTRRGAPPEMRPTMVGGEPILSASDLATAFQLDAPRGGFFKRARRLAWQVTKVVVVLVVVLGAIATAIGLLKPAWRDQALAKSRPYLDRASGWWNEAYTLVVGSPPPKEPAEPPSEITADQPKANEQLATKKPADEPTGAVPPTTPIKLDDGTNGVANGVANGAANGSQVGAGEKPTDQPADHTPSVVEATPRTPEPPKVEPKTAPNEEPKPEPPVTIANAPPEEPKVEAPRETPRETPRDPVKNPANEPVKEPAKDPVATGTRELTLEEAIAQANELRNSALDAEARKDWRAAVVIYEQIATLPEAARPTDLKVKLAFAREQLAK